MQPLNDPHPKVKWGSPNIDTDISFTAHLKDGNLFVAGKVIGDAFPSTEVFLTRVKHFSTSGIAVVPAAWVSNGVYTETLSVSLKVDTR